MMIGMNNADSLILKVSSIIFALLLILSTTMPNANGQVYALTKYVNKKMVITLKNTGKACISSFLIMLKQGSVAFVKAKHWERKRIDDKTVTLTSNKALEPNAQLLILLIWKDSSKIPPYKISGRGLSICS